MGLSADLSVPDLYTGPFPGPSYRDMKSSSVDSLVMPADFKCSNCYLSGRNL